MSEPKRLIDLANDCRRAVEAARKDLGHDLCGYSMLDLVADQFPTEPLRTLRSALVVAGLDEGKLVD